MQTLLLTILVLGILVFVHELGHFATAKWAGIAVPRFSIGLGPRLFGFKVGGTDYCISAIPFGGYVKMAGMEGEEAFEAVEGGAIEDVDLEERVPPEQRFESKSVPWRLLVLSAGVLMNFLLGWFIYVGLAWRGGIPTVDGTRVAAVDSLVVAEHPEMASLVGAEIRSVDGIPVENWYEITGTIFDGDGPVRIGMVSGEEIVVQAEAKGERQRVALAIEPLVPAVVAHVDPGSPADLAGIRPGDRIVAIDGEATESFGAVSRLVRDRPGQLLPVRVERPGEGGESTQLSLTVETGVQKAPRPTDGKFVDTGYLGVGTEVGRIELSSGEAIAAGTRATLRASTLILGGLYDLVTGGVSMRSLGGPVAIGQLTG
ncbi:MAG TPA: RIP metalloprotease RseP, partial [Gemmatimonadota bacterium]|nr:RIP metalloprotease RseP [Gemmatimonadota bacterium]